MSCSSFRKLFFSALFFADAVVKVLGRGSFGTAYVVRCKADSFTYVMKKLALDMLGPKERAEAVRAPNQKLHMQI